MSSKLTNVHCKLYFKENPIIIKKEVLNMAQIRSTDWMRHIPKLLKAGAVLVIISIFLPATHNFQSVGGYSLTELIWYFGLYFYTFSGGGDSVSDTDFIDSEEYLTWGIAAIVLFIFAFILMVAAASKEKRENDHKITAATGLLGGILAFIGLAVYYFGLKEEFPGWWSAWDPSIGFYLPIIGGILGILGGIGAGYAYSQERGGIISAYQPQPLDQPTTGVQVVDQSQQEKPMFCKKCGTKLVGDFCQECGAKAEL